MEDTEEKQFVKINMSAVAVAKGRRAQGCKGMPDFGGIFFWAKGFDFRYNLTC